MSKCKHHGQPPKLRDTKPYFFPEHGMVLFDMVQNTVYVAGLIYTVTNPELLRTGKINGMQLEGQKATLN